MKLNKQQMEKSISKQKKINFDKSGYYLTGLVVLTLLGFWPTYFSKYIDGSADFNMYFHFHALMASLWIIMLITQPILIRKKKFALHRKIGKLSYFILPLFFLSVILLKHFRIGGNITENLGASLWLQTKDLVIIGIMFTIAIINKHNMQIHARAMIATGIVFIEPTLGRFIILKILPQPDFIYGLAITVVIMYILIISLIFMERKQHKGRWVFPLLLVLFIIFHYLIFTQTSFPLWDAFAKWFAQLPLT